MSKKIEQWPEKTVSMSLSRYEELIKLAFRLDCLEKAGVEFWDGYKIALEIGGYLALYDN